MWPLELGYLTSRGVFNRNHNVDTEDGGSRYLRHLFDTLCQNILIFIKRLCVEDSCVLSVVALPVDMTSPRCVLLVIKVLY